MNVQELASTLQAAVDQLVKAHDEIINKQEAQFIKIANLEALLAKGGEVPAEVLTEIEDLKAITQSLDDIVPDAAP